MKLGKWLGLAVAAVVLAEGIWAMLVSLVRSLLMPLLARVLGGDPHSPLYLGTGDINIPDLFGSILLLCLAGIVFLAIRSWAATEEVARSLPVKKVAKRPSEWAIPIPTPNAAAAVQTAKVAPVQATESASDQVAPPAPASFPAQVAAPAAAIQTKPSAPEPEKPAKPQKPAKPEKPREVYYNIVGEPISPTEED